MSCHGYFDERIRLYSFENWPLECKSGILLAKEGVYFSDSNSKVICVFCYKYTDLRNDNTGLMRILPSLSLHHEGCFGRHDERNIPIINNVRGKSSPSQGRDIKYGAARFLGVRLEVIMALQEIYDKDGDDQRIVDAFLETLNKNGGEWSLKDIVDILG